jgi:hypothetical protein
LLEKVALGYLGFGIVEELAIEVMLTGVLHRF